MSSALVDKGAGGVAYDAPPNNFIFQTHAGEKPPMLRITPEGFFVRGEPVAIGADEARAVYDAFVMWMREANMRGMPR